MACQGRRQRFPDARLQGSATVGRGVASVGSAGACELLWAHRLRTGLFGLGTSPRRSFLGASLVVCLDVVKPSFFLFPFGLIAVTWAVGLPFPVVFACFCLSMLTVRAGELAFLDRGAPALGFLYGLRTVITKVDSNVRSLELPVCAGEPAAPHDHPSQYRVYPRACGGTLGRTTPVMCNNGMHSADRR